MGHLGSYLGVNLAHFGANFGHLGANSGQLSVKLGSKTRSESIFHDFLPFKTLIFAIITLRCFSMVFLDFAESLPRCFPSAF